MLDPVLSDDVLIMPCKGILKGCAMSLPVSYYLLHYKENFCCLPIQFLARKHMQTGVVLFT